jgi:hypothetical protein
MRIEIERTKMHTSTRTEEKTMMNDKPNEKNVKKRSIVGLPNVSPSELHPGRKIRR